MPDQNGSSDQPASLSDIIRGFMAAEHRTERSMDHVRDGLQTALQLEYDRYQAITRLGDSDPMTLDLACSIYVHHDLSIHLTARLAKLAGDVQAATRLRMRRFEHKAQLLFWRQRIVEIEVEQQKANAVQP